MLVPCYVPFKLPMSCSFLLNTMKCFYTNILFQLFMFVIVVLHLAFPQNNRKDVSSFSRQTSFSPLNFNLPWNSWFATSLLVDRFWCFQRHSLWLLRRSRTNICLNLMWLTLWTNLHWRELHSSMLLLKKDRKCTVSTPSFPRFCWWAPLSFHDLFD